MIVYQQSKTGFLEDVFRRDIEDVVLGAFKARTGKSVSKAEVRSWKESLLAMAKVLNDPAIADSCGVGIEYGIPQSSKRIDFVLSGYGQDDSERVVIVELKQWTSAKKTEKDGVVRTRFERGEAEVSHPSYQAWSYAALLRDFNEEVYEGAISLMPCAYLHNHDNDGILTDPFYGEYLEKAPVFLRGEEERNRLRGFISKHVRKGDSGDLLYRIDRGRIRPSKGLVDALTGMLSGNQEFVLVDDQKVAYETILENARRAKTEKKKVVIVEGGPGTGKSVIAVNLLAALTESRLLAKYVTKNRAPRAVFEKRLSGTYRKSRIANLFVGSGAFTETETNVFDVLIVDEAHRLNEKSGLYANKGDHQIAEIIGSAKCSVFFIDEDQRVTWKDVGEKTEIERRARRAGAAVTKLELASQFRCSGSNGYLAWLDDVLGIRETANTALDTTRFDFQVFDSPEALRRVIVEKNRQRNAARMVAGYCWDWKSKKDPSAVDVVIPEHNFGMQWNLTQDGGLWIIAPESVEQIGCIHTCQGLEVDYIGVVIGPDLVVRDGQVQTRPEMRSKHDQSIKGYKQLSRTNPDAAKDKAAAIIKNTYRTLMTRGMRGCYIHCIDPDTGAYFRGRLAPPGPT